MSMTQTNTTPKPTLELAEAQSPNYYVLTSDTLREFSEVMTEATQAITQKPKEANQGQRQAVLAIAEASARGLNTVLIEDSTLLQNEKVSANVKKAYGINKKPGQAINSLEVSKGIDATLALLTAEHGMDNEKKIQKHFSKEASKIEDVVEGSLSALTAVAEVREQAGEGGLEAPLFLKQEIENAEVAFDNLATAREQELIAA